MLWRKISLALATLRLFDLAAAFSNKAVFEAQFLNVTEELKFADEKYGGYEIIEHRVSHRPLPEALRERESERGIYCNLIYLA